MHTIAFFNNKGGVGKTSIAAHVAWMLADMGKQVVVADLDPQANMTSLMCSVARLETLIDNRQTVFNALRPLFAGTGDIARPHVEMINERLGLLPGDLHLATSEEEFNSQWPQCLNRSERAYRVMSAFSRIIKDATDRTYADYAIIDVGPSLGGFNRAALLAADSVIIPVTPDLYSLHGSLI
jgi:chromosome partitioning protein